MIPTRQLLLGLITLSTGCNPDPAEDPAEDPARHVYVGVRLVVDRPTGATARNSAWFDSASRTSNSTLLAHTYVIDEDVCTLDSHRECRVPLPNARIRMVWRETPSSTDFDVAPQLRTDGGGHAWALWDFDYIDFLEANNLIDDPSEVDSFLPIKDHLVVRFSYKVSTGQFEDLRTEAEVTAPSGLGFASHGDRVGISWRLEDALESEERGEDDGLHIIQVSATLPVAETSWDDHYTPNELTARAVAFYGAQQALQRYTDLGLPISQVHRCANEDDGCGPNGHDELEVKYPTSGGAYTPYAHRIQMSQAAGRSLWTSAHEIAHTIHLNAWEEYDWPLGLPNYNYGPSGNWSAWGLITEEYEWAATLEGFATFMEASAMIDPDATPEALILQSSFDANRSMESGEFLLGECSRIPFNVATFYWDLYKLSDWTCASPPCANDATSLLSVVNGWDAFPHEDERIAGYNKPNIVTWRDHAEAGLASASTLEAAWTTNCMDQAVD